MGYSDPDEQRRYMREWKARRRSEWFAGKVCAGCGAEDLLELDHIDPATKVSHAVWTWSQKRRDAELAKCQVLCHDCHLKKTVEWWHSKRRHGTDAMRRRGGCECWECKEYVRRIKRESRARLDRL